jgi:hypothetical protein
LNYKFHYDELIRKYGKKEKPESFSENHHILPKSMGGTDDTNNLVYLTPREHLLAHWLLWKIHRNRSMAFSFWMMQNSRKIGSTAYNSAREANSYQSKLNNLGRKRSPETNAKIVAATKGLKKPKGFAENLSKQLLEHHHLAKQVKTPFGVFKSARQASVAESISHRTLLRRVNSDKYPEYVYYIPIELNELS